MILVPEGIDSISIPNDGEALPVIKSGKLCWFGYPESFEKSFKYIFDKAFDLSSFEKSKVAFITSPSANLHSEINHIAFSESNFYKISQFYEYSLLCHFGFDCHLNTIIKSPNKLITSLVRGMIPLASNTSNYKEIMNFYNLEEFMFKNGDELVRVLGKAKNSRNNLDIQPIADDLLIKYSPLSIAKILLNLM